MKEEVSFKLDLIADIWNSFIWKYEFCQKRIKFTSEVQTNYFGDMFDYFQDTFKLIFSNRNSNSQTDKFSNQISLLQSIYVQQDFIEELLLIFKCGINKGDLKRDSNYYINRNIRNELVGHPIRKHKRQFISSCIFEHDDSFDNKRLSRSKYEAIAWAGLGEIENNQSTIAWQNLISSEQQAITNILNKHFFNGTSNCN